MHNPTISHYSIMTGGFDFAVLDFARGFWKFVRSKNQEKKFQFAKEKMSYYLLILLECKDHGKKHSWLR